MPFSVSFVPDAPITAAADPPDDAAAALCRGAPVVGVDVDFVVGPIVVVVVGRATEVVVVEVVGGATEVVVDVAEDAAPTALADVKELARGAVVGRGAVAGRLVSVTPGVVSTTPPEPREPPPLGDAGAIPARGGGGTWTEGATVSAVATAPPKKPAVPRSRAKSAIWGGVERPRGTHLRVLGA